MTNYFNKLILFKFSTKLSVYGVPEHNIHIFERHFGFDHMNSIIYFINSYSSDYFQHLVIIPCELF